MSTPLRVLIVEDSDDDAQLLLRHLRKGGYRPDYRRVQSAGAMAEALRASRWDLVLSDNSMPGFNALAALDVLKASGLDLPFIIVSGDIDEITAVGAMKTGAHDYLLKGNLNRLLPVIQRELGEASERSARRNAEAELNYYASHDALTGLLNRREFERRLEAALHTAQRNGIRHVLCQLDLDQFRLVNDSGGHHAGDELLKTVARRLQEHLRGADTLARLGGDEFALLLEHCDLDTAQSVLDKLREACREFRVERLGQGFELGISIGLVEIDAASRSVTELLGAADLACATAKERGRNRSHVYEPDDLELLRKRQERHWPTQLLQALDNNRYVLYSQPIVANRPGGPVHHEILLRLYGPDGELILPSAFIAAAERYQLMPAIDRWVITTLFRRLSAVADASDQGLYFVNLSGATINDDRFLRFVSDAMLEHGIRPQRICFEITETVAILNIDRSMPLFRELKKLGCSFALDDFGSGLSSFGYLKSLPVDFLKIDGSFVRNLHEDAIDRAMVEAIQKIGSVMGLRTIAECVEDPRTLPLLTEIGVDFAQGYALGHPEPL